VKILSYETGEECAPGETGKILVRGDGVMNGYLNDVEESSLKLKSGWYDTGDLGYMDADGFLYHKGPTKAFRQNRRRNGVACGGRGMSE
jgi:acyl-[acyl-carrier-protein]-phospholipid O-acyltransferase/long-chain-fatty-acid--[acyl-carrier-protein] ligase